MSKTIEDMCKIVTLSFVFDKLKKYQTISLFSLGNLTLKHAPLS